MSFTTSEKLQIAMLCDLAKPQSKRELDFEFINRVVSGDDNIWALDFKYTATPPMPCSPPPATTSAACWPGSPFGAPSSWRCSSAPLMPPSRRSQTHNPQRTPRRANAECFTVDEIKPNC
jgi:hypothetical protein